MKEKLLFFFLKDSFILEYLLLLRFSSLALVRSFLPEDMSDFLKEEKIALNEGWHDFTTCLD